MKLYFRADTRPPETIFRNGFQSRYPVSAKDKNWWLFGLSAQTTNGPYFPTTEEIRRGWDKDNIYITSGYEVSAMESNCVNM
jgi:hypothetical protein